MKQALALSLLLLALACGKTEDGSDELTGPERDGLRTAARAKCISSSNKHFTGLKDESNAAFYGTKAYARGTNWTHIKKKGSEELVNAKVTVWSSSTDNVYFVIRYKDASGTITHQFLKVPKLTNNAIYDKMQNDYCDKVTDFNLKPSSTTGTYSWKSAPFPVDDDTYEIKTGTYTYNAKYLAFMSMYIFTEKIQPYKESNDTATGTATNFVGTFVANSAEDPQFQTYAEYSASNPVLCVVHPKYSTATTNGTAALAYPLQLDCPTTAPYPTTEL